METAIPEREPFPTSDYPEIQAEPFRTTLEKHGLSLTRGQTSTLQVNVGLVCNQTCKHCHLEAGPDRTELMDDRTRDEVISFAKRGHFETIDVTGGAPELHPRLLPFLKTMAPLCDRLMVRSNLSAMEEVGPERFVNEFVELQVVVVASLPATNPGQTESQRGIGVFDKCIRALKRLNGAGYGMEGSGLELDLVSNPTGAFLPPAQEQAEKRFRDQLMKKWGIRFNRLFTFGNAPLGRFRKWLHVSGNLDAYLDRLAKGFNPCAVEGVMCRTLVSVAWDGNLYDCDFNLARKLPMGRRKTHVSEMDGPPEPGSPIAVGDHCYTCVAGAGFT
ncbi:MAG: arsenosugar biosynthesis radical SAM (seleno)protein ArsS [Desulfatiglandaceae bacterium]